MLRSFLRRVPPDPATGDLFVVTYLELPSLFTIPLLYPFCSSVSAPVVAHVHVWDRIKSLGQYLFIPLILLHDNT